MGSSRISCLVGSRRSPIQTPSAMGGRTSAVQDLGPSMTSTPLLQRKWMAPYRSSPGAFRHGNPTSRSPWSGPSEVKHGTGFAEMSGTVPSKKTLKHSETTTIVYIGLQYVAYILVMGLRAFVFLPCALKATSSGTWHPALVFSNIDDVVKHRIQ